MKNLKKYLLILAGFLVVIMPLAFFTKLADDIAERKRETTINLLVEKLGNNATQLRENLKPENYVRSIILAAEKEFLLGLESGLSGLYPDSEFGDEYFNQALPDKIYQTMLAEGLEPFIIQVTSNAFAHNFYRLADEVIEFCGTDLDLFLARLGIEVHHGLDSIYARVDRNRWNYHDIKAQSKFQKYVLSDGVGSEIVERYLSRYNRFEVVHDQITSIFTDYYGKQTLYAYSKGFASSVGVHGTYLVIVRREAINPELIIASSFEKVKDNVEVKLVELSEFDTSIQVNGRYISTYLRLPTELFNHINFREQHGLSAPQMSPDSHAVHIAIQLPDEVLRAEVFASLAEWGLWLAVPLYLGLVLYLLLRGMILAVNIKTKLAIIFAGIVLVPVLGTSFFVWSMSSGEPRMIEKQTRQLTENQVNIFRQHIHELNMRYILAAAHIKQSAELAAGYDGDFWKFLLKMPATEVIVRYFSEYYCLDKFAWFAHTRVSGMQSTPIKTNNLIKAVTGKFMGSLGVLDFSNPAVIQMQKDNIPSLAMLEGIVTPEIEEAYAANEGTVQKDLTMSPDTIRAVPLLVSHKDDNYSFIMFSGLRSNSDVFFSMVNDSVTRRDLFEASGDYADISLAVRLRTSKTLRPFIWPPDLTFDSRINDGIELAMSLRDSGTKAFRLDDETFEIVSWFYEVYEPAVLAARGVSRPATVAGLILRLAVPGVLLYSILVLSVISVLSTEFMVKPIKVMEKGIERINDQHYGTVIAGFSNDEFSDVAEAFNEMSLGLKQREIIRRHVSEKLFEHVQAGKQKSEKLVVTVLASDIRGFTSITEKYSPAQVVEMLNSYFTAMEKAIKKHGGIVDKYIGDAIQAVFYQEEAGETAALRACRAAMEMRRSLCELNSIRRAQGLFTIENGVGLATGSVISGSIGSEMGRKDYSITGKVTEIAADLEAKTVNLSSRILMCSKTFSLVKDDCETADFNSQARELKNV